MVTWRIMVQDWTDYLETLIEEPENRAKLGRNAYQDVLQRYHPAVRAAQLVDTLNLITAENLNIQHKDLSMSKLSPEKSPPTYWSSAEQERYPTLIQRGSTRCGIETFAPC